MARQVHFDPFLEYSWTLPNAAGINHHVCSTGGAVLFVRRLSNWLSSSWSFSSQLFRNSPRSMLRFLAETRPKKNEMKSMATAGGRLDGTS